MMNLKYLSLSSVALFALASSNASAGVSSGGGYGVVCRENGAIKSIELLDLFEGKTRDLYEVPKTDASVEQAEQRVLARLDFDRQLQKELSLGFAAIAPRVKFLPAGVALQVPTDQGEQEPVLIPTGCALEVIAYFQKNGTILVSRDLFDALSATDQAALWAHEAAYYTARERFYVTNSYSTRKFVGALFASNSSDAEIFARSQYVLADHTPGHGALFLTSDPATKLRISVSNPLRKEIDIDVYCLDGDLEDQLPQLAGLKQRVRAIRYRQTAWDFSAPLQNEKGSCEKLQIEIKPYQLYIFPVDLSELSVRLYWGEEMVYEAKSFLEFGTAKFPRDDSKFLREMEWMIYR